MTTPKEHSELDIMIDKGIEEFLVNMKLYPFTCWNRFNISHPCEDPGSKEKKEIKAYIKNKVGDKSGVYGYLDKNGCLLYVGKAALLSDRLYSHYKESFIKVSVDHKSWAWYDFFGKYNGKLQVIWLELNEDRKKRIIEEMIELHIKTRFDHDYPRMKRKPL